MSSENNEFDSALKKLSEQVSQFAKTNVPTQSGGGGGMSSFLPKINIKSPLIYYAIIPLAIVIVLFFWKPKFVTEEVSVEGELPTRKLSIKRLLLATVIMTVVIAVLIFACSYRKKNAEQVTIS